MYICICRFFRPFRCIFLHICHDIYNYVSIFFLFCKVNILLFMLLVEHIIFITICITICISFFSPFCSLFISYFQIHFLIFILTFPYTLLFYLFIFVHMFLFFQVNILLIMSWVKIKTMAQSTEKVSSCTSYLSILYTMHTILYHTHTILFNVLLYTTYCPSIW